MSRFMTHEQCRRFGARPPLGVLRFEPIQKRLIWGGRRLADLLGKRLGPGADYAESWELSDHRDDISMVAEGPLAGTSLRQLVEERALDLFGPSLANCRQFPLLVKFLDANQTLSVQVHPDDEQGRLLANDNGKTEAWVVMHAEPGALIYAGLRADVGRDEFAKGLETGQVEPLLHRFEARPGQCIFIPAGTVHAIGAGVVLAEIQQMSDATFRVFDWGREGPDGKPRKLHLDEALVATDFTRGPVSPIRPIVAHHPAGMLERLVRCPQFVLERLQLRDVGTVGTADRFTIVICLRGSAEVGPESSRTLLKFAETLLLPADLGPCELRPAPSGCDLLLATVP